MEIENVSFINKFDKSGNITLNISLLPGLSNKFTKYDNVCNAG